MISPDEMEMRKRLARGKVDPPEKSIPEQFVDEVAERAEETVRTLHGNIRSEAGPAVMQLVGVLSGNFWKHQKRVLDVCELLCRDDHQWQTARAMLRSVQYEQLREMSAIVRTLLAQAASEEEGKEDDRDAR